MKYFAAAIFLFSVLISPLYAQAQEYDNLKAQAEKLYAEGSYGLCYELYQKAAVLELPKEEKRWVDFRLADTLWRSQAATETSDSTKFDQACRQLEVLVRDIQRSEEQDRVWVEVQESLADFYWTRRNAQNWQSAWVYYQRALDWWAGSAEIDLARKRYISIVKKIARPDWSRDNNYRYYYYGYYGNILPLEILENVLKITKSENDKTYMHYLIAMTMRYRGGDWQQIQRAGEEFEAALKAGKSSDWHDDALYYYAEWLCSSGKLIQLENGQYRQEPDYLKALELFRRLVTEYQKGETRYYDQAKQQIENIAKPVVNVRAANIFLPDSEIQVYLDWRNTRNIDFTLYKIDLSKDIKFSGKDAGSHNWLQYADVSRSEKFKSWSKQVEDKGDYKPGQETLRFDYKLPLGAYILEAKVQGAASRELILVTDTVIVMKTSGKQALVYYCNALDGSPVANAQVSLWERSYNGHEYVWRQISLQTNQDGLCLFDLSENNNNLELFTAAVCDNRQAFSLGNSYDYRQKKDGWKIYAFCDKPAYTPQEKVQWKFICRRYDGMVYSTPAGQTIEFQINDPRGNKVKEGRVSLNDFGSAWGDVELNSSLPLGEYQVSFWDENKSNYLGNAVLFRLEEYKLPEFKVNIKTAQEDGKKKVFCLGDTVQAEIEAEYYFGGPVANADVEVLIYQNAYNHFWSKPRDFSWFYEDMLPRYNQYYGGGQVVKREKIKTNAAGKTMVSFETPRNAGADLEYRIEARVVDASRREIVGVGNVRVSRQSYYVYLSNKHNLYKPQDKVEIEIKALDVNEEPQETEGTIKVTRDYWFEIWISPEGKEISAEELKRVTKECKVFPPPPANPQAKPWQLKFRGYQHDDVLTRTVKTDAQGQAEFSFTPQQEGYYSLTWNSRDKRKKFVTSQTTVWVANNTATELGYRHGGLEIIVDKDTFKSGQTAAIMLNAPTNGRYVLFSVEGDEFCDYRLVRLSGTVKLIELPIEEKHVPNIFLNAAMVSDQQLFMDTKQVIVPPVKNFLELEIKPDKEQYQPREEGNLSITARDHEGKPVCAEVALAVADESVYYIQSDYAQDPRQFYFGTKRQQHAQTQSTFFQKSYVKLIKAEENQLIDERVYAQIAREDSLGRLKSHRNEFADRSLGVELEESNLGGMAKQSYEYDGKVGTKGDVLKICKSEVLVEKKCKDAAAPCVSTAVAPQEPAVEVRSDFRSALFWQPDIITDARGKAQVKIKFNDSLTGWKITGRVAGKVNQFGMASADMRTKQPLIVRLQAPRFFLVKDTATVSANINNNTQKPISVMPALKVEGLIISGILQNGMLVKSEYGPVNVPANGQARVDWVVRAERPGEAALKVLAIANNYSDAMEKKYPVYEHGVEKFICKSGKMRSDEVMVKLDIPKERKPESTNLTVQVSPSMAVTMLDALPYLVHYPYGCTEQTMSRFLPAAVTLKTLKSLNLKPQQIMNKVFGGIEPEFLDKTHPEGKEDFGKLNKIIKEGLQRLYDFQHSDGGWGWWKEGESDHFMSAYVVWGLSLAQEAGIDVKNNVLNRALDYLDKEIVEEETNYDMQAWILHALSVNYVLEGKTKINKFREKAFENLWKNKDKLNAYTRALLAISAYNFGYKDKANILIQNLANGVKIDNQPDVSVLERNKESSNETVIAAAHWGEDGIYWRWSDGGVEATAFALQALLVVDPENKLIEPVTNWLIKNRRGAQWSNTRDTAITVLTLNRYLRQSKELESDLEYELYVNNNPIAQKRITPEQVFSAPSSFEIERKFLKDGVNEICIKRKKGDGSMYFAAQAKFFSLEEPVSAAGNEIFVARQYYKLVGHPTLLKGYTYDKQPLNDGQAITSGERVETVITIEAKNNYEYLVFEDLKPAGFEAVEIRSGNPLYARELKSGALKYRFEENKKEAADDKPRMAQKEKKSLLTDKIIQPAPGEDSADYTGRSRWVYQELRERKVALFIDKLPEGVWEIRYDLRAETPGEFHALPVMGYAMYVPEIRANSKEIRVTVEDKKQE